MNFTKENEGVSLLEVVLALALLAVVGPSLFGIFFANANLSKKLSLQMRLEETADDVKSFLKLGDYGDVYNLAKDGAVLAIEEVVDGDGFCVRRFVRGEMIENRDACSFAAKFEFADCDAKVMLGRGACETCAIPLRCKIYHVGPRKPILAETLPEISDAECDMVFVKNR
ncbi:MAG: hypothetical protein LBI61_02285 [Puniceicoccales bacterium]|nr:hypothetical protein [Puniceicoccales bacterium]